MNTSDGSNGRGNRRGIGIEIARSRSDLETFRKAEEKGAELTAWILQRYGWGVDRVKQHADFAKKNCLPIDATELLTKNGWVSLGDIKVGDIVAQWNNGIIEFVPVSNVVEPYRDKVYKSRRVEATGSHEMLYRLQRQEGYTKDIWENVLQKHQVYIPMGGLYNGKGLNLSDSELRFLVWVQADGHYAQRKSKYTGLVHQLGIEFHFHKENKAKRLHKILNEMGQKHSFKVRSNGNYRIRIHDSTIKEKTEKYLDNKQFSWKFLEMNEHQRAVFFDELLLADGSVQNQSYFSSKQQNYDVVSAIASTSNLRNLQTTTGTSTALIFSKSDFTIRKESNLESRTTDVGCVTVPSGNILIRQYGQPKVVGNCPHRTRELGWNRFIGMVEKYLRNEQPSKQFPNRGKVIVGSLNVRPTAGVNGSPIGKLKLNEIVEITGVASNGWYEIDYKGQTGYVSNLYITITEYGDSYRKPSEVVKKKYPITGLIKNPNSSMYIINKLNVIETTPENIEIIPMFGKAIRQSGRHGINGTFFDTPNPASTRSIWGLAINDSKPIGENSHTNHWNGTKRGTISWFGGNKVYNQYINNINDYSQMPIWAIGGMNLISRGNPDAYNPKLERVPDDWTRRTYHTALAYKEGKIYLITSVDEVYLNTFKNMIESAIDPDSCINLDGGGSTQMAYGGKFFGNSARRLSNAVVLKRL